MIISWIGYCLVVSALLGLAALAAERALGHYRRPVRGVWLAALIGSVLIPVVAYVAPTLMARFATVKGAIPIRLPDALVLGEITGGTAAGLEGPDLLSAAGTALGAVWLASVVAFASYLAIAHRRLRREMSGWTPGEILDAPVMLTPDRGPAVVGLGKGVIVMPAWISELEEDVLRLVFLHEREHVLAGDNRLFSLGLLAVAAMPWNPAAWWQLRRMRLAIEFDCDRRVMARGVEPREYAEALLAVGGRLTSTPLAAAGFAERKPAVERRLRRMTEPLRRLRGPRAAAAVGVSTLAVVFACGSPLPTDTDTPESSALAGEAQPEGPGAKPQFIPYDQPPAIKNREEMAAAFDEFYPATLRAEGLGGRVELWLYLDRDGNVANRLLKTSSSREEFDRAAMAVIERAEFSPASNGGVETDVWVSQWITFQEEGVTMLEPVPTTPTLPYEVDAPSKPVMAADLAQPLIVIDGVIQAPGEVPDLDELDVEHIEVIKGGAARSIYGDRARDGVVKITTKAGVAADPGQAIPSELRRRFSESGEKDGTTFRVEKVELEDMLTTAKVGDRTADRPDPLIVIDGVIQPDGTDLSAVSKTDIDHVEVIKGEAARERYGSRAANGVVQITTKAAVPDGTDAGSRVEKRDPGLLDGDGNGDTRSNQDASGAEPYRPPPALAQLGTRGDRPAFIPYDRPPRILNVEELVTAVQAAYPEDLRARGVEGRVEIWMYVDANGVVANQEVKTSSGNEALDTAAAQALRTARFRPAVNRDQPTAVWLSQWVTFEIS